MHRGNRSRRRAPAAFAYAGGSDYEIAAFTIDGGGGTSSGGGYILSGTLGQPDAGAMGGGDYVLTGGLWAGDEVTPRCPADIDGNGLVDVDDLVQVILNWGVCA